jgi:tetratricopeptide (TPR) repeat protein
VPIARIVGAAFLVLAPIVAYTPAMDGGFIWDDDVYVAKNEALRDLDGLRRIWTDVRTTPQYYPLTHTTFWVQYQLWQTWTFPYHLLNVLLHGSSAVLLWSVLARLGVPGAWLASALFALHPVQVESVAWITERKNVLSGVLYLGAALAYLQYAFAGQEEHSRRPPVGKRPSVWLLWISVALFSGALLSKTVVASLPVALALVLWWKRGRLTLKDTAVLVPMLLAGAVMGYWTAYLEKYQVGAVGEEWSFTLVERCLIAGRALWFYLSKLVWPFRLTFVYPRWTIDSGIAWQYLFPLAALAGVSALFLLRRRLGWGPLVAFAYFSLTLVPALGFFDVYPMRYSFVADHFQYLASIGPLSLAAVVLWRVLPAAIAARGAGMRSVDSIRGGLAAAAIVGLGSLTFVQAHDYQDIETLWRRTLARNPEAAMAHYNLGLLLDERDEVEAAIVHYRAGLAVKPDMPDAHNNLARALARRGEFDEAMHHYRESLRIDPAQYLAYYNLGVALEQTGRLQEAMDQYQEAIRRRPEFPDAHNNLATVLYKLGRLQEAVVRYREAITRRPEFAEARSNLALVLFKLGRFAEAWSEVEICRKYGFEPPAELVSALTARLEPSR